MIPLTLAEIHRVTGGQLHGTDAAAAARIVVDGPVVTDSREAGPGSLYVARIGEQADGHRYLPAAAELGAVAAGIAAAGGNIDRRAISISGGRTSPDTDWQSKLEWREDQGAEQREQWVSTHRLTHKINESWRIAARLNYADTDDHRDRLANARFIEGNAGFAWRPWDSARWEMFGRYTYLYDLSSLGQREQDYDQKTQVLSVEGVYRHDQHWEVAGKLARREGEVRYGRGSGPWFDSATDFAALQLRYEVVYAWHALAEYRWLDVQAGGTRQGWLVGLDRDIGKNFRIGAGYNFTEFSDDLTDFDYDHEGWFLNMVGMY